MTLFKDSEVYQKERPTKATQAQIDKFYIDTAKEIIKEGYSEQNEDDIIEDLKKLYPFRGNGYELAKELEREYRSGYEFDVPFCEYLDTLSDSYHGIIEQNVKDWVKAHQPVATFEKGAKLMINETLNYSAKKGSIVYVTGKSDDRASYYINEDKDGNGGWVYAYELIEKQCSLID